MKRIFLRTPKLIESDFLKLLIKELYFWMKYPSLSLEAQSKLLRASKTDLFEELGSSHEIRVDVRIIAAANQNLRELIQAGDFREDLFHRLDLLRIQIPPLSSKRKRHY